MYQVVMLNDDYTPMEFVVLVLQEFFNKDREAATQIMLKIHLDGKGVCGIFSRDVAATKVDQVLDAANQAGHPLQCVSEPAANRTKSRQECGIKQLQSNKSTQPNIFNLRKALKEIT